MKTRHLKHYRLNQFLGRDGLASTVIKMGADAEILSACGQIEYDRQKDTLIVSALETEGEPKEKYEILAVSIRENSETGLAEDFKFINSVRVEGRNYLIFFKKFNW